NPNQQIINLCTKGASFHQEAAEAEAAGLNQKAEYLSNAGHALYGAAREARWPTNPKTSKQIIDRLIQSASFHQEAAEAEAAGHNKTADYFNRVGEALYWAANEAQKPNPKQQSIDQLIQSANLYQQSASLRQQAAEAKAAGHNIIANYFNSAGNALLLAANEARWPTNPKTSKQSIDLFTQSASLDQKAVEAEAAGHIKIANYFNRAGSDLYWAAREAQNPNLNQQRIDQLIQSANLNQQFASLAAQEAQKTDTENRALSDRFGMDMVQFHEGVGDAFDDDYVGTLFNDAAQAYRSSISAEKSGDASAATSWRDIGNHYRDAAKECKDFLEKNNLTPQDSRFDAFLNQSIEGGRTIKARLEEAISLRNQLGKSKT
ncbi:MAG: hypothetical protein K9M81_02205, partial [Chthoniobacterales bacterium]|nr:hypothetical protein [Chthoniobacterales bacterium]